MPTDVAATTPATRDARRRRAATLLAWERFVAGDDEPAVATVPAPILRSWRRCRDVHGLDPMRPTGRAQRPAPVAAPRDTGIYAQLGAVAATVVREIGGCLATVTDADAEILACWSAPDLGADDLDSRFEPGTWWPESVGGTNGMGTALLQSQPVVIRGPEHWRRDMHEWSCVGLAVHDPVTARPVGAVNVAARSADLVAGLATRLADELEAARRHLRFRAVDDARAVSERFAAEDSRRTGTVLGLDLAGNVVAASDKARRSVGGIPAGYLLDPALRRGLTFPPLAEIARRSWAQAVADPSWTGTVVIGPPLGPAPHSYTITPVNGTGGPAGWIVSDGPGPDTGSALVLDPGTTANPTSGRIAALAGDSVLLLGPEEIRFAEANRHDVWLTTDCGRFRAATRGMDHLARELSPYGFLRVHRSFLVNPARIRRVVSKGNGLIALSTDHHRAEDIPVSRRSTHEVRQRLGI